MYFFLVRKGRFLIGLLKCLQVNVVDTVGCGDSFVAAVAFGYINNMPLINTLAIANAVGAATAMGCGAGRNVATLERVIELMKAANIGDDGEFWDSVAKDLDISEVVFLSRMTVNGNNNQRKHVSLQKIVSELLPQLESAKLEEKVSSS